MFRNIKIRHAVIWPPVILLLSLTFLTLSGQDSFITWTDKINAWILETFGNMFLWVALFTVITCLILFFTPVSKIRIGGPNAKPILKRWQWFSIVLCTTIATGILFWGTIEPLTHYGQLPEELGIAPFSREAARFSMSTVYMHWSLTPYAIYTVAALAFALAYYNAREKYSLSASLFPFFRPIKGNTLKSLVDGICLFTMVAGMAASLGAGIISISGGLNHYFGFEINSLLKILACTAIVIAFTISAISGIKRGIRILSNVNAQIFMAIAVFVFLAGPLMAILNLGAESIGSYFSGFFTRSLMTDIPDSSPWPDNWTIFYWANWMAWAPITSLFLGQISVGYTVREFLMVNWIIPSVFGIIWMSIFGITAIELQSSETMDLYQYIGGGQQESIIYQIIDYLPLSLLVGYVFLVSIFLSYVTAADSSTTAMAGISSSGITPDSPEPHYGLKIFWGVCIGIVALLMIVNDGLDGIRKISNLGGLPAMLLILFINIALIWMLLKKKSWLQTKSIKKGEENPES